MKPTGQHLTSVVVQALTILGTAIIWTIGAGATMPSQDSPTDLDNETAIALAMSAGPAEIAKSATIVKTDSQGKVVVLRQGSNSFTCTPGNPKVIGVRTNTSSSQALQIL